MQTLNTINILKALANGIDPLTGEQLPAEAPYQQPAIIRALFEAVEIIQEHSKKGNQGNKWTTQEDQALVNDFQNGITIPLLAKKHGRTYGAIRSRLVKLGLIKVEQEEGAGFDAITTQ